MHKCKKKVTHGDEIETLPERKSLSSPNFKVPQYLQRVVNLVFGSGQSSL
jgi:hypothetical protein